MGAMSLVTSSTVNEKDEVADSAGVSDEQLDALMLEV